jgi:hypothetical protein
MSLYQLRKLKSKKVVAPLESERPAEDVIAMTIDNLVARSATKIHAYRDCKYNGFLVAYAHRNNLEVVYLTEEQQKDYEK